MKKTTAFLLLVAAIGAVIVYRPVCRPTQHDYCSPAGYAFIWDMCEGCIIDLERLIMHLGFAFAAVAIVFIVSRIVALRSRKKR